MSDGREISQIKHALAYLQQGWHLVFMSDGSKGPSAPNWNAPSQLVSQPGNAAARLAHGAQNMGLCHQPSGTMALDVDNVEHSRFIFDELGLDYDDIMGRGMRIKSREGRDKVIFRCPDMPLIKIQWPMKDAEKITDRITIIEFRAGPNQDVLPPSKHPEGHLYEWWPGRAPWDFTDGLPEIPSNLLQLWQALADRNSGVREELQELCPWRKAPAGKTYALRTRRVSGDHQDVIGKFNSANDIGSLLEGAGYKKKGRRWLAPTSSTAIPGVVVLDDRCYSHHGSDVLADGYAHDAFDLLCKFHHNDDVVEAIKDAAQQLGIDRDEPKVDQQIDMASVLAAQAKRLAKPSQVTGSPSAAQIHDAPAVLAIRESRIATAPAVRRAEQPPEHLLRPPGIVGDAVQWLLANSVRPQPLLAVGAMLSVFATVLGRKVASDTGLRTNLYIVGVAGTGRGKDMARVAARALLADGGMSDNLGGEEFASGQGLLSRVSRQPSTLFLPDEFGMLVAAISGKNAANHERAIMKSLMTLYNSTNTTIAGSERADQKLHARVDISYPCVNLYGVTTPETFYPALTGVDVASGWLNRMIVLTAPEERPAFQQVSMGLPPAAIQAWIKAAQRMRSPATDTQGYLAPVLVPTSGMAKSLFTQFQAWLEGHEDALEAQPHTRGLEALWARSWEMAVKIAMVLSVGTVRSEDLANETFEIDYRSAQWAIDFVKFFMTKMEIEVASRVGDGELDRIANDVLRIVKRNGELGYTAAELCKLSRPFKGLGDKKKQQAILELLQYREEAVLVEMVQAGQEGKSWIRKRAAWVAVEYAPHNGDISGTAGTDDGAEV